MYTFYRNTLNTGYIKTSNEAVPSNIKQKQLNIYLSEGK